MITNLITTFSLASQACEKPFFGLKTWFHYLEVEPPNCNIKKFDFLPANGQSDLLLVGVALIDNLLRIAGLVAIGYIIYGGILYVTSQGSADQTAKAQNTIQNALIGLVIAVIAVAVVSFIGNRIG